MTTRIAGAIAPFWVSSPRAPGHDPDEVDRLIRRILDGQAYESLRPSLLERARDRVLSVLADLLGSLTGSGTGTIVAWTLLVAGLAVTGAVVVRLLRTTEADRRKTVPPEVHRQRSAGDWRRAAQEAEERGQWRTAVGCRFRALISDLVQAGVLDAVPGRTVGAYRGQVLAHLPGAATVFGEASDRFEAIWYGDAPAGPEDARQIEAAARTISDQRVSA